MAGTQHNEYFEFENRGRRVFLSKDAITIKHKKSGKTIVRIDINDKQIKKIDRWASIHTR